MEAQTSTARGRSVLVTGANAGLGRALAETFARRGDRVILACRDTTRGRAAAREIQAATGNDALEVLELDLASLDSVRRAADEVLGRRGPLDALVNNAGIGGFGALEATPMATARELFETNTFGVMAMTQAVLPQLRGRRSGVIVNVTSSATLGAFPLVAAYTASKAAIEGFSASLALELEDLDVRVKLVEPGYGPTTNFTSNGGGRMTGLTETAYAPFVQRILDSVGERIAVAEPSDVAEAVWRAVHDTSGQLHFPAGADAVAMAR